VRNILAVGQKLGSPLLVWINGAFGAGKSSVARELVRRWPEARLFDPEEIGFLLRRVVPAEQQAGDFQDLPRQVA